MCIFVLQKYQRSTISSDLAGLTGMSWDEAKGYALDILLGSYQ